MTEDEADDLLWSSAAAVEAGVLALHALARGEAADPAALEALVAVLEDPRVQLAPASVAAAGTVRELRGFLTEGIPPSPEARALAARCSLALATPPSPPGKHTLVGR